MNLVYERKDYFIIKAEDMNEFIGFHFCRNYDVIKDEQIDSDGCCVWIYPEKGNTDLEQTVEERIARFMNGSNGYMLFFLLYHLCLKEVVPEGIYVVVE